MPTFAESRPDRSNNLHFTAFEGSLPERLTALLGSVVCNRGDAVFELGDLALTLGQRLPDQAQTMTYWQRGDLGRALRNAGFGVRVELGRVIFVPRRVARWEAGDAS